jgi:hypothetical protein
MKKPVAAALVALAALATPLAIGQSQGLTIEPMSQFAGTAHTMQVKAASFFAPRTASSPAVFESAKPGLGPDPATSWLMALAIFGIIAVRRMRG